MSNEKRHWSAWIPGHIEEDQNGQAVGHSANEAAKDFASRLCLVYPERLIMFNYGCNVCVRRPGEETVVVLVTAELGVVFHASRDLSHTR